MLRKLKREVLDHLILLVLLVLTAVIIHHGWPGNHLFQAIAHPFIVCVFEIALREQRLRDQANAAKKPAVSKHRTLGCNEQTDEFTIEFFDDMMDGVFESGDLSGNTEEEPALGPDNFSPEEPASPARPAQETPSEGTSTGRDGCQDSCRNPGADRS